MHASLKREITGPIPLLPRRLVKYASLFTLLRDACILQWTTAIVGQINICQRYYDRATLHFLERSLGRIVTPADVLLKFLKLCVSETFAFI